MLSAIAIHLGCIINWNEIASTLNSLRSKIHQMISIICIYIYQCKAENTAPEKNYTSLLLSRTRYCVRAKLRGKNRFIGKKEGKKIKKEVISNIDYVIKNSLFHCRNVTFISRLCNTNSSVIPRFVKIWSLSSQKQVQVVCIRLNAEQD